MPLPANGTPWPPREWSDPFTDMAVYAAWWSGDTSKIREASRGNQTRNVMGNRRFWNRQNNKPDSRPSRSDLHIPLASDLTATSADIVYGNTPTIESKAGVDAETSVRIGEYLEAGLQEELLKGAELGAALGGRYHSVVFDPAIDGGRPFLTTIRHDHALPTFRWGRLWEVTFWSVVAKDNAVVWRHVEHHELAPNGVGITLHGLYEGTADNLGAQRDLAAQPATAGLQASLAGDNAVLARSPGLSVVYIPNITPNRCWQDQPLAVHLGRSDLEGLDGIFDAIDEVYNSWMRDVRLGKARVFADRSLLERPVMGNPGAPTPANTFDLDRELFVSLEGIGSMAEGRQLQMHQFAIRVDDHQKTVQDLIGRAVRAARYSVATFEDAGTRSMTATEIRAREKATKTTRDRKIALEKRGLTEIIRKMLTLDTFVTKAKGLAPDNVVISWPSYEESTVLELAQTSKALRDADSASLQTRVQMVHPDWNSDAVDEEVDRIREERSTITSPDMWRPNFQPEDDTADPEED